MARLVVLCDGKRVRDVRLGTNELRIGADPTSDVVIPAEQGIAIPPVAVRCEGGRYVLVIGDAGTSTGSSTRRPQRAELRPGIRVPIGRWQIEVVEDEPKSTMLIAPGTVASEAATSTNLPRSDRLPEQSIGTDVRPAASAPRRPQPGAQKPGFIAWLARQPKPLVFGGAFLLLVLIAALGPLLNSPATENRGNRAASPQVPAEPVDRVVPNSLVAAREALDKGRLDEAVTLADKVLAIDRDNAEAIALRTRAQEMKAAPASTASAPPSAPAATPPPNIAGSADVVRRAGETDAQWHARVHRVESAYADGVSLLGRGSFPAAADAFAAVMHDAPGYRSAEALHARATQGMADQARQALDNGMKLEAAGDLLEAMQEYERAARLNPSAPQVSELIVQLRSRMIRDAGELYTRAKSYEKLGRIAEAIDLYERVTSLLPPDDPRAGDARGRIKALRRAS